MMYTVRLEANVTSVDLADVEIEAASKEEAINKAIQGYANGTLEVDWYASDDYNSELNIQYPSKWLVEEIQ